MKVPLITFPKAISPDYEVDHYLARSFRDADLLLKDFDYDLSQLDRKDFTDFIQLVFEPEFLSLEQDLSARGLYISKDLFPIFKVFTKFVPLPESKDSVYYNCYGHIDFLQVQVCEKPLFNKNGILLYCLGGSFYKTYLRINGLERM